MATSISPTLPILGSRVAPQLSIDSGATESARLPRTGLEELLHTEAVFQCNPICVEEIQEDAARCRMPSRSVDYRRALRAKPVQSATDVVNFRDHEVDVMEHRMPATYHSDAVMKRTGIRTHERQCFANAVGNAKIQHVTKEDNGLAVARRAEHDVAKPLNPGVI